MHSQSGILPSQRPTAVEGKGVFRGSAVHANRVSTILQLYHISLCAPVYGLEPVYEQHVFGTTTNLKTVPWNTLQRCGCPEVSDMKPVHSLDFLKRQNFHNLKADTVSY